jgi:hypothetical protein
MPPTAKQACQLYARVLTRPVFTSLARGAPPESVFAFLSPLLRNRPASVASVFETAFETVRREYRNEYVYKSAIAERILFGRHSPRTSSLAVELPVAGSIVDVAIFNGTTTAYEIKTEFDSPRRLSTQTVAYLKAFDRVYVVTPPRLAEKYARLCDDRVGILVLNSRESLSSYRPAVANAAHLEQRAMFRIMRRPEFLGALERAGVVVPALPNGLIDSHCEAAFSSLPLGLAYCVFLHAMRERSTQSPLADFILRLPMHLRVLGLASPLSGRQRNTLLHTLEFGQISL